MPEPYRVFIKRSAERELRDLPGRDRLHLARRIHDLSQRPRPNGREKLSGQDAYRIRRGDYRIVYTVDDEQRLIQIYRIGHRREVYR